ncbi:hypothetical protein N0M98_07220 [Paenibacillus doosanensis]|uniref:hypothetical protein n=1 Tax=Paenibacillus doosanensis TaxID=1229154 RepID=UPI00217FE3A0|nr:hypothetical protein [Paenibacillus doosanensis]MCS7459930.1 hypothetical protein [Paenibacillus doosanensis]
MKKKRYPLHVFTALLTLLFLGTLLPGVKAEASDVQVNSLSQALNFATRYVETKYPYTKGETIVEDYREIDRSDGKSYNVFFKRVIQGTEFPDNNIFLSIDTSGKIMMEQINWDRKLQLPSSGAKISEEAAKDAFLKQIQPLISYRTSGQASRGEAKQRYLEYWINQDNRIDAETGQLLGEKSATAGEPAAMKKAEPLETQGTLKTQTASSAKPLITKDDALQRALLMVKPPRGAGAPNIYTNDGGINDFLNGPFWNVFWSYSSKTFETGYCPARVQLQQSTGLLVDYYNDCPIEGGREVSEKEAKQKASDFINQFASDYTQGLVLSDVRLEASTISSLGGASHYTFFFLKHTNGGTERGSIVVSIDKASGEVAYYTNTLSEPMNEDLQLDETKLKAMLVNKFDLKLSYEAVKGSGSGAEEEAVAAGDVKPVSLKLVYRPVAKKSYIDYFLDAKDGVWRNSVTAEAVLEEQLQSGK